MEEKSLPPIFSQLIPDSIENSLGLNNQASGEPSPILAESLKALAGQAGGPLKTAVEEFLDGKGELHEATRTALVKGGASAESTIVAMLTNQFKLSPALARIIAPILVKLVPSLGGVQAPASKPKPKPKPKPAAHAKPKPKPSTGSASTTGAHSKPKPKPKPKPSSSSKPAAHHKKETTAS